MGNLGTERLMERLDGLRDQIDELEAMGRDLEGAEQGDLVLLEPSTSKSAKVGVIKTRPDIAQNRTAIYLNVGGQRALNERDGGYELHNPSVSILDLAMPDDQLYVGDDAEAVLRDEYGVEPEQYFEEVGGRDEAVSLLF